MYIALQDLKITLTIAYDYTCFTQRHKTAIDNNNKIIVYLSSMLITLHSSILFYNMAHRLFYEMHCT
jgi:hypothetical protein